MKKLSIIIPAYNEERSISQILGKIHQTRLIGETEKEILIIDDGSKDSTAEKCRQFMQAHPDLDIHYHLQPFNQGKGAALRTGIALATGDWIIIQDADLEYDPEDYNPLLQWVIENNAKVVYGSRFLKPSNKHSNRCLFCRRFCSVCPRPFSYPRTNRRVIRTIIRISVAVGKKFSGTGILPGLFYFCTGHNTV